MNTTILLPITALCLLIVGVRADETKPNVLFIIADDLMKQVELYGHDECKTPNLAELASDSLLFDRAYCQYPLCGPSRASLMLSKYPDHSGITWNQGGKSASVQKKGKSLGITTMPAYFKNHGYITVGGGKLYHNSVKPEADDALFDFTNVLSSPGKDGIKTTAKVDGKKVKSTLIADASNYGIDEHKDGALVKQAKAWLAKHTESGSALPFFMCVGIKKPHSPFSCPKQFFDLYDRSTLKISNVEEPNDILAHYSLSGPGALLSVHSDTKMFTGFTLPKEKKLEIIHAYRACVSYTDHLVGDLVRSLKENGLYDNTIIVFTSDHGYKLGEYNRWAKFTLHEKDAVVPFLVRVPKYKENLGKQTKAIVGLIDIYPTLTELCGLPKPKNIDGKSFVNTLKDNSAASRKYIRTVLPRTGKSKNGGEDHPHAAGISIMHDNGYRYHQWWQGSLDTRPVESEIIGYELYDHYHTNNSAISNENLYKERPEILKTMRQIELQ